MLLKKGNNDSTTSLFKISYINTPPSDYIPQHAPDYTKTPLSPRIPSRKKTDFRVVVSAFFFLIQIKGIAPAPAPPAPHLSKVKKKNSHFSRIRKISEISETESLYFT